MLRDFHGAVHQIKPDEAIVVTTKGFTREAKNFANDEGIKLAILREFEESDWEGRFKSFDLILETIELSTPIISYEAANELENKKLQIALEGIASTQKLSRPNEELYYDKTGNVLCTQSSKLYEILAQLEFEGDKEYSGNHVFDTTIYLNVNGHLIGMRALNYKFNTITIVHKSVINSGEKVALLLLDYLDGDDSKIIFDDDLTKWEFTENGEVIIAKNSN
ncbi:restriction endonuclease [Bacillus cereus]|uniref:restriction endonuclease n=1 Tax=Bacillus cereus TaxID=1396 RepID=UPI003CFFDDAA